METENIQIKLNGKIIYSLEELKENFNVEELVASYKDGSLIRWLEFFSMEIIADKIRAINPNKNLTDQLKQIFMDGNESYKPQKNLMHDNEKTEENLKRWEDIFPSAETLMKEAENYYAEKNYREAVKKYMDAYCLGNDEAVDKLRKLLTLSESEKQTNSTEILALKEPMKERMYQQLIKNQQQRHNEESSKFKQTIKQLESEKQSGATEIDALKKRIAELEQMEQRRKEAWEEFIITALSFVVILIVIPFIFTSIHDAYEETDDYIKRQGGIIAMIESFFYTKLESKTDLSFDGVDLGNEISDAEKVFGKPDSMDLAIYPEHVYTSIESAEGLEDKVIGDEYYLYFDKYNLEIKVENEHIEGLSLSDVNTEKVLWRKRYITTPRGIHLGSTYEDIIEAYGYSYKTISRGVIKYSFTGLNDRKGFIVFTLYLDDIDNIESGVVRSISMFFDQR